MPPKPHPCGTPAGAARHRRRGEEVCDPCRDAARTYGRERYHRDLERSRYLSATRARATTTLRQAHPIEWEALWWEAYSARRVADPDAPHDTIRLRANVAAGHALRRRYPLEHAIYVTHHRTQETA